MFLEPHMQEKRCGWLEIVCGSMFSGKTEELIRRLRRAKIANQKVIIFKPQLDTRYAETSIVSHDSNAIEAKPISNSIELLEFAGDYEVIGVDEAQFFDMELTDVCQKLALDGKRVIIAGLDMDYLGQPFGPIPNLLSVADYITKVHAICPHCGSLATHSYRMETTNQNGELVVLGEKDIYEPRCRSCYAKGDSLEMANKITEATSAEH